MNSSISATYSDSDWSWRHIFLATAIIAAAAAIELAMGRVPTCTCGTVRFWVGNPFSPEASQQIADWYTFSHVIHGFIFFAVAAWLFKRWPMSARLALAVLVEAGWELLENSPIIIERYRATAMAAGYIGDSVLNSISDIVFMAIGFLIAARLPAWMTIAIAIFFELLALYVIRDNLTLNVLMLIYPFDAIKEWQAGAAV